MHQTVMTLDPKCSLKIGPLLVTASIFVFRARLRALICRRRNGVSRIGPETGDAWLTVTSVSLEVALVQDVVWDTEAFKLLVVDKTTKELIQAVVTNQIKVEQNTDLIRGKGNGLFILLHG